MLEGGRVLEKAAANISVVTGVLTHERAKAMSNRARGGIDPAGGQSYSGAGDGGWAGGAPVLPLVAVLVVLRL